MDDDEEENPFVVARQADDISSHICSGLTDNATTVQLFQVYKLLRFLCYTSLLPIILSSLLLPQALLRTSLAEHRISCPNPKPLTGSGRCRSCCITADSINEWDNTHRFAHLFELFHSKSTRDLAVERDWTISVQDTPGTFSFNPTHRVYSYYSSLLFFQ